MAQLQALMLAKPPMNALPLRFRFSPLPSCSGAHSSRRRKKAANADVNDSLGRTGIALDRTGSTLVAGAISEASSALGVGGNQSLNDAPETGAAYVFSKQAAGWIQQVYLKADESSKNYKPALTIAFGNSTALNETGTVVAVGTSGARSNAGAAYVYR